MYLNAVKLVEKVKIENREPKTNQIDPFIGNVVSQILQTEFDRSNIYEIIFLMTFFVSLCGKL